jgi:hypothetical protein
MTILLPTIAYHYSQSANLPKAVDFLEALAILQIDQSAFAEVVDTITRLISFFAGKTETQLRQVFLEGPPSFFRRAVWSTMLGEAQRQLHQNQKAVENLKMALKLVGQPWPKGQRKLVAKLVKQVGWNQIQGLLMILRLGGSGNSSSKRRIGVGSESGERSSIRSEVEIEQMFLEYRILNSMCDVLLWEAKPLQSALAVVRLLNLSKLIGTKV